MTSQLAITHPFKIVTVANNKKDIGKKIVNLYEKGYCKPCRYFESDQHHNLGVSLNPVYDSTSQPIIYFLPRQKVLKKYIKKLSTNRFEDRYFMLKDKHFTLKQHN
jgi:hypothetical protein